MPLKVNEFIIQAKFEDDNIQRSNAENSDFDIDALKQEILKDCMEKIEEFFIKRENR